MNTLTLLKEKLNSNKTINISHNDNKLITFLNPYSYLFFRKNSSLFSNFDIIFIDGILLVYLLRFISIKSYRHSFDMTSLAHLVFDNAIKTNKSIYFVGSKEEEINEFIIKIKSKYPDLKIIGYRNGYFDKENRSKILKNIVNHNPDIIITGMGTPYQEEFLIDLRQYNWKGTGYTCGGFFHQTAKKLSYYPEIFNKLNLRWLYRISDEPKLFIRYALLYPKSIVIFIFDAVTLKLKKSS